MKLIWGADDEATQIQTPKTHSKALKKTIFEKKVDLLNKN